jgi:hypothetical protein
VRTCEQCGADTLNAQGRCATCGWQAPLEHDLEDTMSPSLGETRAAEIPEATAASRSSRQQLPASAANELFERTTSLPPYAPPPPRAAARTTLRSAPLSGPPARYCGACGARIGVEEAFCGQCGTPVGAADGEYTSQQGQRTSGAGRYGSGMGDLDRTWTPLQGDDPTEAFVPASGPYGRGTPSMPYAQAYAQEGYGSGFAPQYAPHSTPQPAGVSRGGRIALGLICLAGSIASAVGAILLASHPPR